MCSALSLLCLAAGTAPVNVLAAATIEAPANPPATYTLKSWDTDDGLPQSTPRAILQTRDGYLWIGTFHGVARFDGLHFQSFTVINTRQLRSDSVVALFEDRDGDLWIGTEHGLVRNRRGRFTSFEGKDGLPAEEIKGLGEDGAGRLWVALGERLFRRNEERFEELPVPAGGGPTNIGAMSLGRQGRLWIGARNGLWALVDGRLQQVLGDVRLNIRRLATDGFGRVWIAPWGGGVAVWEKETLSWIAPLAGIRCSNFAVTRAGHLWFGSMEGDLFRWADETLQRFGPDDGLGGYRSTALAEDVSGNLWVGRGASGVYRMRPIELRTVTKANGLTNEDITSVIEGNHGAILLGTFGGGLIAVQNERCSVLPIGDDSKRMVTSILNVGEDGLWIGDWGGKPVQWKEGKAFGGPMELSGTRAMFKDREGALWIGSNAAGLERLADGRLDRFTTGNGLSSDHVLCIAQDHEGTIWVGTERGLNRLAGGRIECFFVKDGLGADQVRALHPDPEGTVFAGTVGGLSAWRGGRWRTLTSREGLVNDVVSEMVEDGLGNLWLGTHGGLMRLHLGLLQDFFGGKTGYVYGLVYGRDDGLASVEVSTGFQPSCLRAKDGRLWFGSGAGAVIVDPKRIREPDRPPEVHVEAVLADGEVLESAPSTRGASQATTWIVPSRRDRLEIRYTGINLAAAGALKFRRQLVGYERDWVDVENQRTAFYTKLPPGKYQFRVIARNHDSVWNQKGATLALHVLPAWWQTLWFRALVAAALLGAGVWLYLWRINQLERRRLQQEAFSQRLLTSQETERKRIAAELHDSLEQNLLVIKNRALLALGQKEVAPGCKESLEAISSVSSDSIQEVRAIAANLRPHQLDRLGLTRALGAMLRQISESSGLKVVSGIDDVEGTLTKEMEIHLYRIVQESLNNMVKHARATQATITLKRQPHQLLLEIRDDGQGFDSPTALDGGPEGVGFGLTGMAERARMLGGQLRIHSSRGNGTELQLTVPNQHDPRAR